MSDPSKGGRASCHVANLNDREPVFASPGGSLDTYELSPGDVYFVPRAYPHHIEDIGDGDLHFLIFFDQSMPADIGYRASASAYSPEVLAAALGIPRDRLPDLPFTPKDPLIVGRRNPVDPSA